MIIDSLLLLSNAQTLTATAASTNYVDLGVAGRDIGPGEQLFAIVQVQTKLASAGGAGTLTVALQTDDNTDFSSAVSVLATQAYAEATLTAGRAPIVIPIPFDTDERYVQLYYTVGGENFTSGKVDAFIGVGPQTNV